MVVKVIDVKVGIFDENDKIADEVRQLNTANETFMVNIMASPGAGKTSTLLRTIEELKDVYRIGVMEADIEASVDAEKMEAAGVRSIQVHTGGECAMDASMVRQTLRQFEVTDLDLLFMENVGNLVCTAEQDTGAHVNVEILSLPEGDDKPLKYPLMFTVCQCVLINKIDTREWFPFDDEAVKERILRLNPEAKIFFVSAKTGEGFEEWIQWIREQAAEHGVTGSKGAGGSTVAGAKSGAAADVQAGMNLNGSLDGSTGGSTDESGEAAHERVLVINPGSTSTKIAVFDGVEEDFEETLRHSAEELAVYENLADQREFRRSLVMDALKEHGLRLDQMSAIACRGGMLRPIPSGTYRINETMVQDCREERFGSHASNLGALIGYEMEVSSGIPAFVVDPPSVDEMCVSARYSGHPMIRRTSIFHALNQKAVARRYASETGRRYEDLGLVVCHMGGGVSVGAHIGGKVIDTQNVVGGEGPFSPGRAGTMPANEMVKLCFSGKYDQDQIMEMLIRKGGMYAYAGTTSVRELLERAEKGEDTVVRLLDAFYYQVSKEIAAMAATIKGKVDQILLTGGIAYSDVVTGRIRDLVEWIAPVSVYPGEDEMGALAQGALRVLHKQEPAKEYRD